MTDFFLQFGISNFLLSVAVAIVAYTVHRTGKLPVAAHLLWVLVLVKLVAPPILTIPVVSVPGLNGGTARTLSDLVGLEATSTGALKLGIEAHGLNAVAVWIVEHGKTGLVLAWLLGSAWVLGWSLLRIWRFSQLLRAASKVAPPQLQRTADQIGKRLGLRTAPTIYTTSAHLPPMVWWVGGRVRILIPAALPRQMDTGQLRWVLAHELAHVRRRDHLVRWLEWLACVAFWWNPVAWWARHNLRVAEEICCDALVLASLDPEPRTYANALMTVVEFLASPAIRLPAVASQVNSGGFLERRFKMMLSTERLTRTPRWLLAGILFIALAILPLGLAYAHDTEAVGRRLSAAVKAGEISREQARMMMDALKRAEERGERRITREEYAAAAAELREAVEAGEISGQDARTRLGQMRRMMARTYAEQHEERGDVDWEAIKERIEGAVKRGEMTREEADARYRGIKEKHWASQRTRGERRFTREEYAAAETKLKAMVAEGKVSAELAERRLSSMRTAIRSEVGTRTFSREEYAAAETKLKAMVAEGKVSAEDAERRLSRMRTAIRSEGGTRTFSREE